MGKRIPVPSDLTQDDITALAVGRHDEVAERLQLSRQQLARLIARDDSTREMILAARIELQAFLEMRIAMMAVDALDTYDKAMSEGFKDAKSAIAAVRAADSILDRGTLPKLTRTQPLQGSTKRDDRLPDLDDLIRRAETDAQARTVADEYIDMVRKIEAMKRGATQIVDGEVSEVQSKSAVKPSDAADNQ